MGEEWVEGFCGVGCKEKVFEEWGVRQKFLWDKEHCNCMTGWITQLNLLVFQKM